ncbi:MAG: hypothetical protein WCJ40_19145 [Planctomycetota bacterium]
MKKNKNFQPEVQSLESIMVLSTMVPTIHATGAKIVHAAAAKPVHAKQTTNYVMDYQISGFMAGTVIPSKSGMMGAPTKAALVGPLLINGSKTRAISMADYNGSIHPPGGSMTIKVKGGQIYLKFTITNEEPAPATNSTGGFGSGTYTIVGGSGAYANAGGNGNLVIKTLQFDGFKVIELGFNPKLGMLYAPSPV